jgi:hypothetical protein
MDYTQDLLAQHLIDRRSFGIYSSGVFWINFSYDTSASSTGGGNVSNADNTIAFLIGIPVLAIIISSYLSHISPVFLILVLSYVAMIFSNIASDIAA